jgi:hypothetical protein
LTGAVLSFVYWFLFDKFAIKLALSKEPLCNKPTGPILLYSNGIALIEFIIPLEQGKN